MEWENIPEDISELQGFVYLITNLTNNKKYIGMKGFWSNRKNKSTGRKQKKESNWKEYYSSCDELKNDVELLGKDNFKREIIHLCYYKKQMSFLEQMEQWKRNVLLTDDYYNTTIGGKYFASERHIFESTGKKIKVHNDNWKKLKSERMKGENNIAKREDIRKKISIKKAGKNHHQFGKQISEYHKKRIYDSRRIRLTDGKLVWENKNECRKYFHVNHYKIDDMVNSGKLTILPVE